MSVCSKVILGTPKPRYNPLWLTGMKAPTNKLKLDTHNTKVRHTMQQLYISKLYQLTPRTMNHELNCRSYNISIIHNISTMLQALMSEAIRHSGSMWITDRAFLQMHSFNQHGCFIILQYFIRSFFPIRLDEIAYYFWTMFDCM